MTNTARLALPLIAAAQSQKHVTHNEALVALDTLVQASVIDQDLATPPGSPTEGDCYIVAGAPTGAWTGWAKRIVRFIDGMWRFYIPGAGWIAYVQDEGLLYVFNGAAWVVFGSAAFQPLDADLTAIAALSPSNDDVIQRKAGAWANRTMAQILADLMAPGEIPFPATQNPSSDPNTLDDYEEGTFTPGFTASTTPPSGATLSTNAGYYTKIGGIVLAEFNVILTNKGSGGAGNVRFDLPFAQLTVSPDGRGAGAMAISNADFTAGYTAPALTVPSGLAAAQVNLSGSAVAQRALTWADCTNASTFRGRVIYRAG